jgi:hypothetical protein
MNRVLLVAAGAIFVLLLVLPARGQQAGDPARDPAIQRAIDIERAINEQQRQLQKRQTEAPDPALLKLMEKLGNMMVMLVGKLVAVIIVAPILLIPLSPFIAMGRVKQRREKMKETLKRQDTLKHPPADWPPSAGPPAPSLPERAVAFTGMDTWRIDYRGGRLTPRPTVFGVSTSLELCYTLSSVVGILIVLAVPVFFIGAEAIRKNGPEKLLAIFAFGFGGFFGFLLAFGLLVELRDFYRFCRHTIVLDRSTNRLIAPRIETSL